MVRGHGEGGTRLREARDERDGATAWHALAPEEAIARLEAAPSSGLAPEEAAARLARHGPNALPEPRRKSALALFLSQFRSPLIYLLLGAAALAFAVGERKDAGVILAVVTLNAFIGAFQEGRAARSLEALRRLATLKVRVLRGGAESMIPARDLVPGDILLLAAGDAVAADARVLEAAALETAEAALTGESLPVAKSPAPLVADTPLGDRRNMVYAGTHVTAGRGRALVVATGPATEVGTIAALAEAAEDPPTPLERRIRHFGRAVLIASPFLFALVVGLGLRRGLPLAEIFMVAVSQVVSMIPEGLPVAVTVALAVGVQRMARRGAIVRRLPAVETLGSTTVILSDKTGTLTRNEMAVTAIVLPDGRELAVLGAGYSPEGRIVGRDGASAAGPDLAALLEAAALCNDARLIPPPGAGNDGDPGAWRALGDPTEAALLVLARKGGIDPDRLHERLPRTGEIPFDPAVKMMATAHAPPGRGEEARVVLKGAPEAILDLCAAPPPADMRAAADRLGARALRVLAFAEIRGTGAAIEPRRGFEPLRGRATFLGLVGEIDPPRPEAADAVAECRAAGIRPVMVTGDHKATGLAVAREIGIAREGDLALDGRELAALSDDELRRDLDRIAVFARVHPAQKLRIVEAFQARRAVVAMTGDGVNDAPALARADVGVAMGITGTEVAKEAAKIVITDDNFATIVKAVEEGRLVYRNLKKAILLLISTGLAEIAVLGGALVLGFPLPLAAVMILWNNVVTEGLITVNLVMEPLEGDEMRRPPIPPGEPLLTRALLLRMAIMTPAIALSTLAYFAWHVLSGSTIEHAQTAALTVLTVCEWFNVLNCRSETRSAFDRRILRNPWLLGGLIAANALHAAIVFAPPLHRVFHTAPLPWSEVFAIGAIASPVLWLEEARKAWARKNSQS